MRLVTIKHVRMSALLPIGDALALRAACGMDTAQRIAEIDRITDRLAMHGIVRKRSDCSRWGEWARHRTMPVAAGI